MKKVSIFVSLCLAVVAAFSLVGCSKWGSLKKAFEKEGYSVVEDLEGYNDKLQKEADGDNLAITMHAMKKDLNLVIFVEFKSTDDMKKFYEDSDTVKGIIKDVSSNDDVKAWQKAMEDSGYAKGNCLVFAVNPLYVSSVKDIVKKA